MYDPPLLSSPDGITWTAGTGILNTIQTFNDVNSNGTITIAVTAQTNSNYIYTSVDGNAWSSASVNISGYGIVWSGTTWMAVGSKTGTNNGSIYTSSDNGTTWIDRTNLAIFNATYISDAVYDGTKWIVAAVTTGTGGTFFYSTMEPDVSYGTNPNAWIWTAGTGDTFSGGTATVSTLAWNGSATSPIYVAAGYMPYDPLFAYNPYTILRSTDGINWTGVSPAPFVVGELQPPTPPYNYYPTPPYYASNAEWNIDRFVAVGSSGQGSGSERFGNQYYSFDGLTWTQSSGANLVSIIRFPDLDFGLSRNFST